METTILQHGLLSGYRIERTPFDCYHLLSAITTTHSQHITNHYGTVITHITQIMYGESLDNNHWLR